MNRISPPPPLRQMQWGDNALSAPTTPANRQPVIDKSKVDPNDLKAAQGMEAMFLDYMMKVMRDTVPKSEMDLENTGTKIYRSMLDSEVAQKAVRTGGIGLADQIVAYLQMQRYNSGEGVAHVSPQNSQNQGGSANESPIIDDQGSRINDHRSTGGTHEGQSVRK